ncbi:hypothetical protein ACP4OV_027062 [Aristida adscensionis]
MRSCRLRRRRRLRREARRDWADGLPMDALLGILHRLDHADVLVAADRVCRSWRRAARDEPSLWRRVAMRGSGHRDRLAFGFDGSTMAREAVRRAAGQCEAFCVEYAADNAFLSYLCKQSSVTKIDILQNYGYGATVYWHCNSQQLSISIWVSGVSPGLKSLRLISCGDVTDRGLTKAVMELPLLEELELSLCYDIQHSPGVYEAIAKACPLLKQFSLNKRFRCAKSKDKDALEIAKMHGLRSLQLLGNALSNDGLSSILGSCHKLEALDIRHCFNVKMDQTLLTKCAGIKTLRLPDDPTDDCDLRCFTPIRVKARVRSRGAYAPRWTMYGDSDSSADSEDSD